MVTLLLQELETAVAVENLELKEQQSDRQELEETLEKLEKHKEKLVQQIKATRQLCYEESQQILSLQAEEAVKENQVEEYEKELARARWRLRRLKEEVKQAKRKVQVAGERDTPLQDSIRQSYEEILQEEHALCSLSGSAVTPQSQMEGSSSPGDTTEDEPIPVRPWGRSQSLPAYADLIMGANDPAFCHNLADTREEVDDSGSSSPKMEPSDMDDSLEEPEVDLPVPRSKVDPLVPQPETPETGLDFYQANPFAHSPGGHDLFNEDLFPKTDSSDGFTSDPFKGSDPFGAELFPDGSHQDPGGEEGERSLSCAENKASTATQCFESEFPEEDSDIEISYSREDLDMAGQLEEEQPGFRPIQSSSEELGPVPIRGWRCQYSGESDPNGYELDLGNISPPSDIEELSLGSVGAVGLEANESLTSASPITAQPQQWISEQALDPHSPVTPAKDSQDFFQQSELKELSLDVTCEPSSLQSSSYDPYGFKLSPEHSSHTLLDPSSPSTSEPDLVYDPEPVSPPSSSFDAFASHACDPYGFKLSPEEVNQEVLDFSPAHKLHFEDKLLVEGELEETNGGNNFGKVIDFTINEDSYGNNLELKNEEGELHPANTDNTFHFHDDLESHFRNRQVEDLSEFGDEVLDYENQEVLEPMKLNKVVTLEEANQELLDFTPENREVLDILDSSKVLVEYENREVVEPAQPTPRFHDSPMTPNQEVPDLDNAELMDLSCFQNQEVLSHDNQIFHNREVPDKDLDGNQEIICKEANNNRSSNSSDSDWELMGGQGQAGGAMIGPGLLMEGDLGEVFRQGGYVGCPDVADDLEPLRRRAASVREPERPVRPPRPSLRAKEKAPGIDLK
uniref:Uncharacterized protein n=1 Tax=Knipowitschia caucasica TaxID=637954 RepID=A0AAV2JSU6_KNICA